MNAWFFIYSVTNTTVMCQANRDTKSLSCPHGNCSKLLHLSNNGRKIKHCSLKQRVFGFICLYLTDRITPVSSNGRDSDRKPKQKNSPLCGAAKRAKRFDGEKADSSKAVYVFVWP